MKNLTCELCIEPLIIENKYNKNTIIVAGYGVIFNKKNKNKLFLDGKGPYPYIALREDLEPAFNKMLQEEQAWRSIHFEHDSIKIGEILDKYEDLVTKIDNIGIFLVAELRKDVMKDVKVSKNTTLYDYIMRNHIHGFSITVSGDFFIDENLRAIRCKATRIIEFSVVADPAIEGSEFSIIKMSKSQEIIKLQSLYIKTVNIEEIKNSIEEIINKEERTEDETKTLEVIYNSLAEVFMKEKTEKEKPEVVENKVDEFVQTTLVVVKSHKDAIEKQMEIIKNHDEKIKSVEETITALKNNLDELTKKVDELSQNINMDVVKNSAIKKGMSAVSKPVDVVPVNDAIKIIKNYTMGE